MPGANFQSLIRALSGSWSLRVQFDGEPGKPRPPEGHGTETWRTAAEGLVFVEEERLPTPGRELHLLGLLWQDRKTGKLGGLECNGRNAHVCDLKGALNDISVTWDGKRLVLEEIEHGPDGSTMLWRESYLDITEQSFTQIGESGPPGGAMARVFTIQAVRVAARR